MAVDPNSGQTVLNLPGFDQKYAAFIDPNSIGQLAAQQGQLGQMGQLGESLLQRGYTPNSGFAGALAQMVQSAIGMHMLNKMNDQRAAVDTQLATAAQQAAQKAHDQAIQDERDKTKFATDEDIRKAGGVKEATTKVDLQYAPQTNAAAAALEAAKSQAQLPAQEALSSFNNKLDINKAFATAGAGEQAKLAQVTKLMAQPDSPEKQAGLTLLLGANAPMVGMMGAGGAQSGASGDDFLKSLNPTTAQQVKALAEGRMQFPSGFALKSPYWQTMLQAVSTYDPSFDAVNYNARASTRKDFTSGKAAQTINALNTVAGHLGDLSDSAAKLNNFGGIFTPLNGIVNATESAAGDPRLKEFEANRKAAVDELTRVYRGSGGSESDVKTWADALSSAGSPAQLQGTIAKVTDLLSSKIGALQDQYKQGMGTAADQGSFISDKAKAALAKIQQRAGGESTPSAAPQSAPGIPIHYQFDEKGNLIQ